MAVRFRDALARSSVRGETGPIGSLVSDVCGSARSFCSTFIPDSCPTQGKHRFRESVVLLHSPLLSLKTTFVICSLIVCASCWCFGADTAAPPPAIAIQPLALKHSSLPNGLEIYSVEDHSTPTVAVQVWYHVGGKDDPNGRSGFAHLFEHMMFKGNEHLKEDTFDQLTENVGGNNNA